MAPIRKKMEYVLLEARLVLKVSSIKIVDYYIRRIFKVV